MQGSGRATGELEVDVVILKIRNSSVPCPTQPCNVSGCPRDYQCGCQWAHKQEAHGTHFHHYCTATYQQDRGAL